MDNASINVKISNIMMKQFKNASNVIQIVQVVLGVQITSALFVNLIPFNQGKIHAYKIVLQGIMSYKTQNRVHNASKIVINALPPKIAQSAVKDTFLIFRPNFALKDAQMVSMLIQQAKHAKVAYRIVINVLILILVIYVKILTSYQITQVVLTNVQMVIFPTYKNKCAQIVLKTA
ncbi:transmembrane protein, putative (macronuclear) [Tetrahymena thermophila SB210]|uniref:Transmembrane protein, putative n=1 Tax=Tetrahymena thermophila (strain SB210) TaxID=312017 RepID=W7X511_TETTS|nr:transmembrane protein, putative [Tetrahymena thermophila SB210]EWS72507.1 transmembrane protein, putative [Tetrahymena thermophila SB210]|eukprot:XP_012654943.1 transmembrane protein, putative [Tetrahymena thermophila SB210]